MFEKIKDPLINSFATEMGKLSSEETSFQLNKASLDQNNENGRSLRKVYEDMISIYEKTNRYLASKYPDSQMIKSQIATNEFSSAHLLEKINR